MTGECPSWGAGQIFNFILKCHCTDDFSPQVAQYFSATAKVVGTRQIKNSSCTPFVRFVVQQHYICKTTFRRTIIPSNALYFKKRIAGSFFYSKNTLTLRFEIVR